MRCQQLLTEINRQQTSLDPEVFCAAFSAPGVNSDFVRNLLTFRQAGKPRPFDGADVNKHIVAAIIGLDKAEALLAVEPLNGTCRHSLLQGISRVIITRFHSTGRCLWERARRRIQKGTAANRIAAIYRFRQQISSNQQKHAYQTIGVNVRRRRSISARSLSACRIAVSPSNR